MSSERKYSITSYSRGHLIYWDGEKWRYADDDAPIEGNERCCARCGQPPTDEGYDACLGHIEGAKAACCGHGVGRPYVAYREAGECVKKSE